MTNWRKYALWFAQEHVDFRFAEISSISKTFNIPIKYPANLNTKLPYWLVELPNENSAIQLASRSVSLRCILELYSHSTHLPTLHSNLKQYIADNSNHLTEHWKKSFRVTVETYNKHFTQKEKIQKIETFNYLPLTGNVDLKTPEVIWWYIEYYGLDPTNVPEVPDESMFGRWISDGRRSLMKEISLKKRKFIGNTSMDPQLSLLMANQGLVKSGDFVFDPFVGTGSLLVAAAKFGAFVLGSDIDYLMLHAKTRPSRITQKIREKDESIRANLKQYNCEHLYIDVLVSDFSKSVWNNNILFDSIITDPPYGIREAMEKIERKTRTKPNTITENDVHYPSTSPYSLNDLYSDLLEFSVKHLREGGRLVCWLPVYKNDFTESMIPQHKSMKLIASSEQDISALASRKLLTYERIANNHTASEIPSTENLGNFREKFFLYAEETRQERRIRRAELKEIGRQEALSRGKKIDENGKVINGNQ